MEKKSFLAADVTKGLSILRMNDFVAQLEPAAQLFRRGLDRSRPAPSGERAFCFGERIVLPQGEERYAGSFRKCQLEIAVFGKSHKDFADKSRFRGAIHELAIARLPIIRWFGELMRRKDRATSKDQNQQSYYQNEGTRAVPSHYFKGTTARAPPRIHREVAPTL